MPLKEMTEYEDEQRQAKFAKTEMKSAESAVNEARRSNLDVSVAAELLSEARAKFDSKEFQRAIELSLECKKTAYGLMSTAKR